MYYKFSSAYDKPLSEVVTIIPLNTTRLDLRNNDIGNASSEESVKFFAKIPVNVTEIDLSNNNLGDKSGAELAQIFAALPASVTKLHLAFNHLNDRSSDELAQAFAAIPASVTNLDLGFNDFGMKSAAELAKIFAAIPASVTDLELDGNNFEKKSAAELAQIFAAIPARVQLDSFTNDLRKAYDMKSLLASYLQERIDMKDSSNNTREYLHCSFFSIFQKSFQQKLAAVEALQSAIKGDNIDLNQHLSTLRNGDLGKRLRKLIKSGAGDALVGSNVTTVSDFVKALQVKNSSKLTTNL